MNAYEIIAIVYLSLIPIVAGIVTRIDSDPDDAFSFFLGVFWPLLLIMSPFGLIYWLVGHAGRE